MSAATAAVQATESKTVLLETNQSFQMDKLEVSYISSYHIIILLWKSVRQIQSYRASVFTDIISV